MLIFHSGASRYAISGDIVIEVVPSVALISLATAPPQVVGLLNYGRVAVPVLDFCNLMENRFCQEALHTRIMLLQSDREEKNLLIGLRAEKVTEVLEVDLAEFHDKGVTYEKIPFLNGILADQRGVIQRVDADKLFEWYIQFIQNKTEEAINDTFPLDDSWKKNHLPSK